MSHSLTIGVLALQGAFREHVTILKSLGADAVEVRRPEQMDGLDGLIIPGGESTSMALIAERWGMVEPLRALGTRQPSHLGNLCGHDLAGRDAPPVKSGGDRPSSADWM